MQTLARRFWTSQRSGRVLVTTALAITGLAFAIAPLTASAGGEKCAAAAKAAKEKAARVALASPSVLSAYGPPMVCHEVLIGKSRSLPWDGGHGGADSKYDVSKLPADTVDLLIKEPSALVRMETLRRAAVYLSYSRGDGKAKGLAWQLIGRRSEYVMFGEASGKRDPNAWFDVAYFIGCLHQVDMGDGFKFAESDGVPGYLLMRKAFKTAQELNWSEKDLAQMQFGAAVMAHPAMRHKEWNYAIGSKDDIYDQHLVTALKTGKGDELLETNIAAHLKTFGKSIDDVRKVAATK